MRLTSISIWLGLVLSPLPALAQTGLPVVAVFPLNGKGTGFKTAELERLTEYVSAQVTASKKYQVVPQSEIRSAIKNQVKKSYKQCFDEKCQIEIGKSIAAEKTIFGGISKFGKRCMVNFTLYDLEKATSEEAGSARGGCGEDDVLNLLDVALGQLLSITIQSQVASATPAPVPVKVAPAPAPVVHAPAPVVQAPAPAPKAQVQPAVVTPKPTVQPAPVVFQQPKIQPTPQGSRAGMLMVAEGRFTMGCNARNDRSCDFEDADTAGNPWLGTFWVDKTEVTVEAFRRCVQAGVCSEATFLKKGQRSACNYGSKGKQNHPMNCVNWFGANSFCSYMKKRLPSEQEWEKSARGIDGRSFPWGLEYFTRNKLANIADKKYLGNSTNYFDGYSNSAPVGSFPQGASPFGVLDMAGNVHEWTTSKYSNKQHKSVRGGSWANGPEMARVTSRLGAHPNERHPRIGFRCVAGAN